MSSTRLNTNMIGGFPSPAQPPATQTSSKDREEDVFEDALDAHHFNTLKQLNDTHGPTPDPFTSTKPHSNTLDERNRLIRTQLLMRERSNPSLYSPNVHNPSNPPVQNPTTAAQISSPHPALQASHRIHAVRQPTQLSNSNAALSKNDANSVAQLRRLGKSPKIAPYQSSVAGSEPMHQRPQFARRPSYASNPVMSQMQPVPLYYPHPAAYSAPYAENDMFSQSSYNQAPYERIAYPSQFAPYQHPIYQTPLRMYDPTRDASSHRNTLTSSTESVHNPGSYTQDSETFLDEAGNLYRRYTPSEVTTAYLPMTPAQHLQHLQQQQQYYMPEYAQRRGMQPEKYEESSQAVQDHATNHRGPDEPTEENANWAVVQNEEQNGVLLVMDTTEGADGYGNIVERGPDGRRGDHMRYLNVVETEPNSYRYQPTGEPFNHTMHQTNTHPQLVQAPDNTSNHPIGFIKKQSATAMQRNHLAHLMTSPKTAPGGVKSPISPGGIPIVSKPSFWSRMFSRMKAVSVYSAILIAAWYVKDPKAVKAMAEKVQRRALAYAVVIFGGAREALEVAKRVAASRSANAFGGAQMSEGLNVKIVWEVVKRAFQRSLQDVIVYGGKALGVDVVVRPAVAAAALKK